MLSVSKLGNIGCKVEFKNRFAKIYDSQGSLIGKGDQKRSNLFYLDMEDASCLIVQTDDLWIWHKKLYHVNFDQGKR